MNDLFWWDAAAGAEFERQIERANVTGTPNRINTASRGPFFITLRDDISANIFHPAFMRGRFTRRSGLQVSYLLLLILKN